MRKFIIAVLALVMLLAVAVSAVPKTLSPRSLRSIMCRVRRLTIANCIGIVDRHLLPKPMATMPLRSSTMLCRLMPMKPTVLLRIVRILEKPWVRAGSLRDNTYYLTTSNAIVSGQNYTAAARQHQLCFPV